MDNANSTVPLRIIAHIHTPFEDKFGLPRQSSLIPQIKSEIVFEKAFRDTAAVRGLDRYSHIWLLWYFSRNEGRSWSPMVRPPRLGGNRKVGVFASRSPFRPSPIGLSAVRLNGVEHTADRGTVLHVSGADLMDGTPILDIKPYLSFADAIPDAQGSLLDDDDETLLTVVFPDILENLVPPAHRAALKQALAGDPRPSYHDDPERVYGFPFAGLEVRFQVKHGVLTVVEVTDQPV